jgi:hypothetical protein
MPTWTTFPATWCDTAGAGINVAIANRPASTGNDVAAIEKWRDGLLVENQRLHTLL